MAPKGILSKARNIIRTIFNRQETPRDMQERQDLYMSILASTHRAMRLQRRMNEEGAETREQVEALVDEAVEKLEASNATTTPIVGLRYELQNTLAPEILKAFETFKDVDRAIPSAAYASEEVELETDDDDKFRSTLMNDYEAVRSQLPTSPTSSSAHVRSPLPYLNLKEDALETVLSAKGWLDNDGETNEEKKEESEEPTADSFGYYPENADDQVNAAIRHYQMINMVKSILIREKLGFSVLSLKSTVPGAGRGVFVDGTAMAGSLIAFFPGGIWPKEYLSNAAFSTSIFKDDNNFQLSIRYDDILIDSRKAAYTVLNDVNSNPWAVGHIVNHPPKDMVPNCRTVAINFTEKMKLGASGLDRYIPNTYAKEPMLTGPKALDRDVIKMHGFGLMAARDITNEELFYDYRLSPGNGPYPDWYYPIDEESLKNRWWEEEDAE
jgi:hypothetical protein